jgi:hypothetical protein
MYSSEIFTGTYDPKGEHNMKNSHFLLYPENVPTIGNMIADKDDHQELHLRYMRTVYQ